MKFAVIQFPGSNCDQDCLAALSGMAGVKAEYVWHKKTSLTGYDAIVLPGGFAFGSSLGIQDLLRTNTLSGQSWRAVLKTSVATFPFLLSAG